jgi:ubiquinone/menaquinone biosynthesis C-methylase UbiE
MRSVPGDSSGWRAVDRDAAGVAHFLEAATQILGSIKRKSIDMLRLQPGASALDVGCGLGSDAVAMAERVGAAGRVVGIDASQELIAKAVERTQAIDLRPEFRVGNAAALDIADDTFDACRTDRMLQHLHDPAQVVGEMVRVTKPGGRVSATDPDWHTLAIAGGDIALAQSVVRHRCFVECRHGDIGRRLVQLVMDAGCDDVEVDVEATWYRDLRTADFVLKIHSTLEAAMTAGVIARDAGEAWWQAVQELDARGAFFASLTGMICAGTVR